MNTPRRPVPVVMSRLSLSSPPITAPHFRGTWNATVATGRRSIHSFAGVAKGPAEKIVLRHAETGRKIFREAHEEPAIVTPLPLGWKDFVDESSGRTYFLSELGDSTWDTPQQPIIRPAVEPPLPMAWATRFEQSELVSSYRYYMRSDGQWQYERPPPPIRGVILSSSALCVGEHPDAPLADGVDEVIALLKRMGVDIAITIGAESSSVLRAYGDNVLLVDVDVGEPSIPHPALYLRAARELGVPSSACAVVDSNNMGALVAATAAGMLTVAILSDAAAAARGGHRDLPAEHRFGFVDVVVSELDEIDSGLVELMSTWIA